MKNVTSILLIVLIFLFVSTSVPEVLADPTIEHVTIDPVEPLPLSTITFNATILDNETIDEVRLLIIECRDDLCFVDEFNISMEKTANDTYQAQFILIQEEATQIKYHFAIKSNKIWFYTELTLITLKTNYLAPGFELVLFFFSAGLLLMTRHYKHKK